MESHSRNTELEGVKGPQLFLRLQIEMLISKFSSRFMAEEIERKIDKFINELAQANDWIKPEILEQTLIQALSNQISPKDPLTKTQRHQYLRELYRSLGRIKPFWVEMERKLTRRRGVDTFTHFICELIHYSRFGCRNVPTYTSSAKLAMTPLSYQESSIPVSEIVLGWVDILVALGIYSMETTASTQKTILNRYYEWNVHQLPNKMRSDVRYMSSVR